MTMEPMDKRDRMLGCLLGGAIGDALGAPVEFMTLGIIRRQFGPDGVQDFEAGMWGRGVVTDDTQMMLFTLEGLIRGYLRFIDRGLADPCAVLHHAYLRWLITQGIRPDAELADYVTSGWLLQQEGLHARRAPGNTCLSALISANGPGSPENRLNDSKGCGGIMRVAPVGLLMPSAFDIGVTSAAITHTHPSGYLAAGYFAELIRLMVRENMTLRDAAEAAIEPLLRYDESEYDETARAIHSALILADEGDPTPEKVEQLGQGWIAEEALAIGLYCALVAEDFRHGVLQAVNHGGDSDSTGMLAGNLLGLIYGTAGIPSYWRDQVEFADLIEEMVDDALLVVDYEPEGDALRRLKDKYPPN
ncbi:ADP-ribosylglycohydrolase family protein [bacterium]|nr:ADP-ribosylglycohydrolase family protein [bacterium]